MAVHCPNISLESHLSRSSNCNFGALNLLIQNSLEKIFFLYFICIWISQLAYLFLLHISVSNRIIPINIIPHFFGNLSVFHVLTV
jgi:hypothetical protein